MARPQHKRDWDRAHMTRTGNRRQGDPVKESERALMQRLRAEGMTVEAIALRVDRHYVTVIRHTQP